MVAIIPFEFFLLSFISSSIASSASKIELSKILVCFFERIGC